MRDIQTGSWWLFEMDAEEVDDTTQTKCCENQSGEREFEEPPAWWVPVTHRSPVFFNPVLLAIDHPADLHLLHRCLRFQGP